jgi:hypothetical protein
MHIAYDSQIFRLQENGGISKYFVRVIENLVLEANRTFPDTIADFEIILKKHGLA